MTLHAVYKCRLCGEKFTDGRADHLDAAQNVVELTHGRLSSTVPMVQMHGSHVCANGDMGLADFMGWEKEAKE